MKTFEPRETSFDHDGRMRGRTYGIGIPRPSAVPRAVPFRARFTASFSQLLQHFFDTLLMAEKNKYADYAQVLGSS